MGNVFNGETTLLISVMFLFKMYLLDKLNELSEIFSSTRLGEDENKIEGDHVEEVIHITTEDTTEEAPPEM